MGARIEFAQSAARASSPGLTLWVLRACSESELVPRPLRVPTSLRDACDAGVRQWRSVGGYGMRARPLMPRRRAPVAERRALCSAVSSFPWMAVGFQRSRWGRHAPSPASTMGRFWSYVPSRSSGCRRTHRLGTRPVPRGPASSAWTMPTPTCTVSSRGFALTASLLISRCL